MEPYSLACPLPDYSGLTLVVNLDMTQAEYETRLAGGEYPGLVDIGNWENVLGERPKPCFPLSKETIGLLTFPLIRYVTSGAYIGDALDAYIEATLPNLSRR